nr:hypothetical protein [Tanacetum cinerariifolium]
LRVLVCAGVSGGMIVGLVECGGVGQEMGRSEVAGWRERRGCNSVFERVVTGEMIWGFYKVGPCGYLRTNKIYTEDSRKYWKIIRIVNHTEVYQFFDDMLKVFDRDDLVQLWSLVKERFSSTEPNDDKDRVLWVELKRLFEPDADDKLWKLQRYMHDPLK